MAEPTRNRSRGPADVKVDRTLAADGTLSNVPATERHFYARQRAFGRFGMRLFEPQIMETPHWHGHIEANFLQGASMVYDVNGEELVIPENRMAVFWASVPHQLTQVVPSGEVRPRLCNIYLPVDAFLFMPHIARLQVLLLGGAIALLPSELIDAGTIERWYRDYRSGDFERAEIVKSEMNTAFRRALLSDLEILGGGTDTLTKGREISSVHIRHVVAMVRFIMENLSSPISNADVAQVTGLHQNYALSMFTGVMRLPMKQFIIRMRLLRARALLTESSMPITSVVEATGFSSISQFYQQFKTAYGLAPQALRKHYVRMDLR
ncbi:MAG: hypothetical protein RLZZ528_744 [Pseudomonadota bacterium]